MMLSELTAKPSYWRPGLASETFSPCSKGYRGIQADKLAAERCCHIDQATNVSICARVNLTNATTDVQCRNGYSGPLCLVCAEGYVTMSNACVRCPVGASFATAMIPLLLVALVLFLVVLGYFYCVYRGNRQKSMSNAKSLKKAYKCNKVYGQMKILLTYFQIFTSMPNVLETVPWPDIMVEFSYPFGIFNLDFLAILSETTCGVSVRFFDRFLLHMLLPLLCLVAVGSAYVASRACFGKRILTLLNEEASKIIILVVLLLFPGLTTKIFQVWKCVKIEGIEGKLLVQDYAVQCHQGEHVDYTYLSAAFLFLYIVGIPLTMFVLMWNNREHLHDEASSRHTLVKKALGGLYMQCALNFLY